MPRLTATAQQVIRLLALLKILAHAEHDVVAGRTVAQEAAFARAAAAIKAAARGA